MILKPRKIVRKFGNKWIRSQFIRESCGVCNNKYCYEPILSNFPRISITQFKDICLYHKVGDKFVVYLLYDGEIA